MIATARSFVCGSHSVQVVILYPEPTGVDVAVARVPVEVADTASLTDRARRLWGSASSKARVTRSQVPSQRGPATGTGIRATATSTPVRAEDKISARCAVTPPQPDRDRQPGDCQTAEAEEQRDLYLAARADSNHGLLEQEPQADLHFASRVLQTFARHFAEVRARDVQIRILPDNLVEQVVRLGPQLDAVLLRDRKCLASDQN